MMDSPLAAGFAETNRPCCMHSETYAAGGEPIVELLSRVDARIRRNEAIELVAMGLWGLAIAVFLSWLVGAWRSPTVGVVLAAIYVAAFAGFVVWRYTRVRALSRSAVFVDQTANLKDALGSALSFLGLAERNDWMELHITRSADTARGIEPVDIAPTEVPTHLYYASALSFVLLALLLWSPAWLPSVDPSSLLTAVQRDQVERIEELLDEAQALAPEEEKLEELEDSLERLRQRDIELSESLRELSEAQEALAASQAELERLEMDLEQLGSELESAPALSTLSEALKSADTAEAAEALRELAERLSDPETAEALQALLESLQNSDMNSDELAEMMENLEGMGEQMTAEDMAQMAQALENMAQQMESMGQQMAAQQDMDQMGQELQQLQASLGQQQPSQQQQQEGQQQQQASGQAMQNQAGQMSNQMQMAQMQGDPSSAVPVDAGPAGETTGPGGPGEDQVFGESTTLDVQLEMEMLSPLEEEAEPVPEEIFERLSREEKSTLNYEDVRGRSSYADESAMTRESVPWQYRSLVKRYFLSLLANAESTEEP